MAKDVNRQISEALLAAQIEFCALSTNGINVYGDRKSIDAVHDALDKASVLPDTLRNLRHWQEECGKLHARLRALTDNAAKSA